MSDRLDTDRLDTVGMWDLTAGLPEQVEAALDLDIDLDRLPAHDGIENVVVLGMGGSGIAGDVLREVAGPFMPVPVVVHKGYSIPNFIGESSLVFAVSFSGNTEETLEAATSAMMQGSKVIALSHGGELRDLAEGWEALHIQLPGGIPMPRAGIGAASVPPLVVLERVGLFPGASSWVHAAVEQLKKRRDQLVAGNSPAEHLAREVGRSIPLMYSGGGIGSTVAMRWKCQVNENAKAPAFFNTYPELCHNEICGWGQHGDVTRQVLQVINLRHEFEHPQVGRRVQYVDEILHEVVGGVHEVFAGGEGPMAQLLDLVLFGDFFSLHLAYEAGVDPGPIPVLDDLKHRLADA
ncbi:MAG: bifunctional phosphoglucose/phosphomannose isomerase [Actinobacteria bacterium]|nr:bifunctional phosphoglucose/phosphomannose isomerase [Actinomycetota bacterium]